MIHYDAAATLTYAIEALQQKVTNYRRNSTKKNYQMLKAFDNIIENLWDVHGSMNLLVLHPIWYEAESQMLEMEKKDPSLTTFHITIQRRNGDPSKMGVIFLTPKTIL